MILSDAGIRRAVADGDIAIDPAPESAQLQTSAVDMFLGHAFRVWDLPRLATPGLSPVLDLAEQRFAATANSFSIQAELERDGSYILKPYHEVPQVLLCQTRERLHLKLHSRLAARVEGRSSLASAKSSSSGSRVRRSKTPRLSFRDRERQQAGTVSGVACPPDQMCPPAGR